MFPKPIYEALPFCYFFVGSGLWLFGDSGMEIAAGILLYIASAQQWILRTSNRRPDRINAKLVGRSRKQSFDSSHSKWVLPRHLYEAMPFIYIAIGYALSNITQLTHLELVYALDLAIISSFMFCAAGFMVLLLRGVSRLSAKPVHVQA
ncbi:MAG: hypothetical protein V7739_00045 [Motiliproteus sp.]